MWIYLIAANVIGFAIMAIDKERAKNKDFRVSEASLFSLAIAGASLGIYGGMHIFRHKTRKAKFRIGLPIIIFLQFAFVIYYYFDFN